MPGRSHLFTHKTTGLPLFCSMAATSLSDAVTPLLISVTKIMALAVSIASSACAFIFLRIISSVFGSIPPVSTTMNFLPHHSASPKMRSRVTPGVSSTIDSRLPTILLKSVDLPTFGLPTTAITGLDKLFSSADFILRLCHLSCRLSTKNNSTVPKMQKKQGRIAPSPIRIQKVLRPRP